MANLALACHHRRRHAQRRSKPLEHQVRRAAHRRSLAKQLDDSKRRHRQCPVRRYRQHHRQYGISPGHRQRFSAECYSGYRGWRFQRRKASCARRCAHVTTGSLATGLGTGLAATEKNEIQIDGSQTRVTATGPLRADVGGEITISGGAQVTANTAAASGGTLKVSGLGTLLDTSTTTNTVASFGRRAELRTRKRRRRALARSGDRQFRHRSQRRRHYR